MTVILDPSSIEKQPNPMPKINSSLREAFERISPDLKAYAYHLTRNASDANDLFQDTGLNIFSNAEKFDQIDNFKAWAIAIMRNAFIQIYRKKNRKKEIFEGAAQGYFFNSTQAATGNGGDAYLAYKDVLSLITALPDHYRRPFSMLIQGFKYMEIADELNIPLKTIKNRIRLARKKLRTSHALLLQH